MLLMAVSAYAMLEPVVGLGDVADAVADDGHSYILMHTTETMLHLAVYHMGRVYHNHPDYGQRVDEWEWYRTRFCLDDKDRIIVIVRSRTPSPPPVVNRGLKYDVWTNNCIHYVLGHLADGAQAACEPQQRKRSAFFEADKALTLGIVAALRPYMDE